MKNVFISHSSKDIAHANAVVEALEREGISVWIAPRDIPAGSNYGASITRGLRECAVLVLVFSKDSNESHAVFREVQIAFDEKKVIIPLRIEDVPVSDDLNFYLSGLHWLDAANKRGGYEELVRDVKHVLQSAGYQISKTPQPQQIYPTAMPHIANPEMTPTRAAGFASSMAAKVTATIISVLVIALSIGVIWFAISSNDTPIHAPDDFVAQTPTPAPQATLETTPEPSPLPEATPEPGQVQGPLTWQQALETAFGHVDVRRESITQLGVYFYEDSELGYVWEVDVREYTPFGTVSRFVLVNVETGEVVLYEESLWTWEPHVEPPHVGQIGWEQALEIALEHTDITATNITGIWITTWLYSDEIEFPKWDAWTIDIDGFFLNVQVWQSFEVYAATGEILEIEW